MGKRKIENFTDLAAWQEAHKYVIMIYRSTEKFPKSEMFGLTNQMRRCAVSVTSNIAEGFSRKTPKDKNNFYFIAVGSVTESQSQLMIARDLKYMPRMEFLEIAEKSAFVQKLIHGLIKYNKNKSSS